MTHDVRPHEPDAETMRLREQYAGNIDNRLQAAALGALALAAMLYPVAAAWLLATAGVRTVAIGLAMAGAGSAFLATDTKARVMRAGTAVLAAISATSGALLPLLLFPAFLYLGLAYVFLNSLRAERSLVEAGARMIQPAVPDFIGPYCRRVTALWGVVFLAGAGALAVAAVAASRAATDASPDATAASMQTWKFVAGYGMWSTIGVISAAEFLVRKTYFRNYWYRGPFERVWSRLFPAEATPMGRRSAEHIRETRRKLGLPE